MNFEPEFFKDVSGPLGVHFMDFKLDMWKCAPCMLTVLTSKSGPDPAELPHQVHKVPFYQSYMNNRSQRERVLNKMNDDRGGWHIGHAHYCTTSAELYK